MAGYMDKFRSTISQNQYNRLVKLLDQKKRLGNFETIDQFQSQMNQLMRDLFEKRITPLLKLFLAIPSMVIDRETYNFMLERIQDDLEIAFLEAAQIDEVMRGHNAILKQVVFRNLKHALAELESKVAMNELLVTSSYGFNKSIASNFMGASSVRLQRVLDTSGYFIDPRTGSNLTSTYDALVDQTGKYLTLPYKNTGYVPVVGIRQIFDSEAIATEDDVEPEDMALSNVIDDTAGTYWARVYLFTDDDHLEVKTKLELDLGGAREINFIEIEPALLHKVTLDSVTYLKGDGSAETISVGETIEHHRVKVQFRKIAARKLILTFSNENSILHSYEVESGEVSLDDVLASPISEQLNLSETLQTISFSGRQFQIGFDNIRVGLSTYRDKGVFISKPLSLDVPVKLLGMKTEELRPAAPSTNTFFITPTEDTYDDTDDSEIFYGSIEYWVIRDSFDENSSLIGTDIFPILPFNVERVNHERLLLTHHYSENTMVNDSGRLLFYTTEADGDIKVYRNGAELTQLALESDGDGWLLESRLSVSSPNGGKAMKLGVRLSQPRAGDIITVSYNPVVSNVYLTAAATGASHQKIVDLVGDNSARSFTDQVVLCSDVKGPTPIAYSQVYLMVILRRNTADANLSPIVKEFLCAIGTKDIEKFQG